ncbi:MAG: substrate-binding domain-containing protein, partial [Victivallales bacterium]|nr:substrate-binding domain-containing protein [Victivallales bacterium]
NSPEHRTSVFENFERGCESAIREADGKPAIEFFRVSRNVRFIQMLDDNYINHLVDNFDAVFAFQDYQLVKLHNMLIARNIDIPGKIALLGFSDSPWASILHPRLSSISTMDALLIRKAIQMMEQERIAIELIKPQLVVRESTQTIHQ